MKIKNKDLEKIIKDALKEDINNKDITSESIFNKNQIIEAHIIAKQNAIICGVNIIKKVFSFVDKRIKTKFFVKDGDSVSVYKEIVKIKGPIISIMKAERVALNFLSFLSSVSTYTNNIVQKVKPFNVKIYDTRKTIPLYRYLEKYSVKIAGGYNHRFGLWDMVLIKDNHLKAFRKIKGVKENYMIIKDIIEQTKNNISKNIKIEIEVETLQECENALEAKPNVIMLDNMSIEMIKKAIKLRKNKNLEKKVLFEVSGGINEKNILKYAKTGIDIISIGAITSSIQGIDFSLEVLL